MGSPRSRAMKYAPTLISQTSNSSLRAMLVLLGLYGAVAVEPSLGAPHDFVQEDRHRREQRDQAEELGRLQALREQRREMPDAGLRHVQLGEQHAEQHAAHLQP